MATPGGNHDWPPPGDIHDMEERKGYALSGKIMLSAILVLFAVVVFMVCLHIYARWYILRARRRHIRQRANLVFYVETDDPNAAIFSTSSAAASRGLDAAVLRSLPVFVYTSNTHPDAAAALECAVCLSEFEENEKGRVLPNCKHSFHTGCIDMWFHSHSTCPLCRSPVEQMPANFSDVALSAVGPSDTNEPACSSGFSVTCHQEERGSSAASSSSLADRRKAFELGRTTIEVPRGSESESELATSSPASQGFKSPYSRLLSLTRILSMSRKSTAGIGTSGGTTAATPVEMDIECGRDESTQQQTRVETPR